MYDDLKTSTSQRIVEIREVIDFVKPFIPKPPTAPARYINTLKGLVYVQLYGLVEYTILKIVEQTIVYINNTNTQVKDLKPVLLSLALSSNLDALVNVNTQKWDKRFDLFNELDKNSSVHIIETIFPTNGKNIHLPQLESIWKTFSLSKPCFHDIKYSTSLKEIVGHRINIAHGNLTAAEIGAAVSIDRLELRLNETSEFCSYSIGIFEDYIANEEFKA